jgi:hypothetical protein
MSPRAKKSRRRKLVLRLLSILAIAAIVLGAAGAVGYYFFTGWRARDLAAKAKDNFEKGNYRMAWLQINSAKDLRDGEPDVLRVLGQIEGAMGRATALEYYEKLSEKSELNADDLQARAEIATRFGNEEQFAEGIDALEKAGKAKEAGELRTARQLRQGDIDRAIAEARSAVAASDDPAVKLTLARLLARRYGPEFGPGLTPSSAAMAGADEVVDIVDQLLETTQRKPALAFALNEANASPENRVRWANAAMEKVDTDNPALLPAAAVLVRSGQKTPQQIHEQLRPVFDAAPLERRAAYVLWLTGAGMPKEAVTMITAQEAGESTAAFGARTEALFATENLDAVLAAVESGGNIDNDVKFAAKARAEYARGRGAQGGSAALREAMGAAAKKGRLEFILPAGESLGASSVVDEKLVELCGDPSVADYVFRVARDRFSRNGKLNAMASAFEQARAVSPQSASVQDYARYGKLLENRAVDLAETSAACAAEPSNVTFRITHALNLLDHGKSAEALQAFDDITVFADRLPHGQLAVIAAVFHANGDTQRARAAAAAIDTNLLAPGEYALIVPIRAQLPAQ